MSFAPIVKLGEEVKPWLMCAGLEKVVLGVVTAHTAGRIKDCERRAREVIAAARANYEAREEARRRTQEERARLERPERAEPPAAEPPGGPNVVSGAGSTTVGQPPKRPQTTEDSLTRAYRQHAEEKRALDLGL